MIRFPIDFKISDKTIKIHLNNEFTLTCYSCDFRGPYLDVTLYSESCNERYSEEFPVSGSLSVSKIGGPILQTADFSKHLLLGSFCRVVSGLSVIAQERNKNDSVPQNRAVDVYRLHGFINVTFNSEKCFTMLLSKGNKECALPKSLTRLSCDFEKLMDPQTFNFSDVNLTCGSVSIPAHKIILSARSPVFAAMFSTPMKENRENKVDISDLDSSVLQAMIIYIYSGKICNLTFSSASDLLFAADKYQLEDLKEVCCDFLKRQVTVQNVLNVLLLGDLVAKPLKKFAEQYIHVLENFSDFENTEEWKNLKKEKPNLAMDILSSLVKSKRKEFKSAADIRKTKYILSKQLKHPYKKPRLSWSRLGYI